MNFLAINVVAVIVSAIIYMIMGFLWYGPLFGKKWMQLHGWTQEQMQQGGNTNPIIYSVPLLAALIGSYILALFIGATNMGTVTGGITVGLLAGVGFTAPFWASNVLFERTAWPLFFINVSYPLVWLVIAGALLGAWQ